jgi:hypothetical protein
MNDLAIRLGKAVQIRPLSEGTARTSTTHSRPTAKGVTASLSRAEWCRVDGIYRMGELPPSPTCRSTASTCRLDDHYRIRPTDLCVVTGIPSHGKTSLAERGIACRMVH